MYPEIVNPPALPLHTFYVLLALSRGAAHAYAIGAIAVNDSLGAVRMPDGTLYPLLTRLSDQALIEIASVNQGKKPGQKSLSYQLTHHGRSYLAAEIHRLQHAVAISESAAG